MKPRIMTLALLGMLIVAGCDEVEDIVSEEELQQALQTLVEADEAFSLDGLGDDGLLDDEYALSENSLSKGRTDTLWPGLFRLERTRPTRPLRVV
jgi:hypothetical protein